MRKLCLKWLLRKLIIYQKQRIGDLKLFHRKKSKFMRRYLIMDETWLHQYTAEQVIKVFWHPHSIIFIDYLDKGQSINSDYYIGLLERLKFEIAEKQPRLRKKKMLFHQDKTPCHSSVKTMAKIRALGFELLPNPPYSPDLAPSDFSLFSDFAQNARWKEIQCL